MRLELTDDLPVVRYAVFAEMAWLERRPELGVICRLARESGGSITTPVIQQALPGLADAASANLIRWCADLGLCDRSGSLTGLGDDVADTDEAPVPEQGVYDVWAARHVLLGSRMLHAKRLTPSRDGRFDDIAPVPIEPDHDTPFASVVDSQRFLLRSFPSNSGVIGVLLLPTRARCQVRWVLDWKHQTSEVRISGFIDATSDQRPVKHDPEPVPIDLWQLMENWTLGPLRRHGTWSAGERRLAVVFAGLSVAEQESFGKDLEIGDAEVPGFGLWGGVRLSEVPIGPASAAEAGQWAMARMDRRLRDGDVRRSRADVRRLFADATEDTPLAPFQPVLPGHDSLLAAYQEHPEVFWRLAAPVDLAPLPVSREELGALKVGEDASGASPWPRDSAGVVRVPYRGGWSMQMLLDQLTEHQAARQFLLVDRYVRGPGNLASLDLMMTTLAQFGQPVFDVWTGDDVDDDTARQIRDITGRAPRRYREVFGHSARPHDRYAVVVPETGAPFGWQMSNSPLDARVDHGNDPSPAVPLRWRDMSATRLSGEQLPAPMAAWARGGAQWPS